MLFVIPALLEGAEALAAALGVTIGAGVASQMVNKGEKEDSAGKVTAVDSTKPCEKCTAIPWVSPIQEPFNGSETSLNYQMRICGTYSMHHSNETTSVEEYAFRHPGLANPSKQVKFDGWKPAECLFLEAKGKLDQFFDKNGKPWYKGVFDTENQAKRQQGALNLCDGIPECHWHCMQPVSYTYYKKALNMLPNITVFYTP
ncbi:restriction endonuclease fold toxin 5 domain-containing protein [Serratia marcescens]|uniref:Tox-REase-5 domain-containing protein n=1 Tax=Serratia marcescens TaxID=615 RepID=UPI001EEF90E7|nr:Tox-REase-5 domain-containing protein [Serratia marcescens]ULH13049.1 restriction endonuclease fold toxin 5 domain-containing protein [Serratia marcescens]